MSGTMKYMVYLLSLVVVAVFAGHSFSFRIFAPMATNKVLISRPTWRASDGPGTTVNFDLDNNDKLNLTVNGVNKVVNFTPAKTWTAAQIAAVINGAAIGVTATVVDGGNGSGRVRLEAATSLTLTGDGGTANVGDHNDLWFENPTAGPYSLGGLNPTDPPPFAHWDLREFSDCKIPYTIDPTVTNAPGLTGANIKDAVKAAFAEYRNVTPAVIDFEEKAGPAPAFFVKNDWNTVNWTTSAVVPDLGTATGMTGIWIDITKHSGRIVEADIILNDGNDAAGNPYKWVNTGMNWKTADDTDIQGVFTHELGHFIGLAHTKGTNAATDPTMSYGNSIWGLDGLSLQLRSLANDDKDGVNFLYTPDLGDAQDPYLAFNKYPSRVHSTTASRKLNNKQLYTQAQGAEHLFGYSPSYQYEWLGKKIDDHCEECSTRQIDNDDFDDGVEFWAGFKPGVPTRVTIRIETTGLAGRYVSGNAKKRLYLHGWFDWSDNGEWEDPDELELWWIGVPGTTDAISANWVRQFWDGDDIELDFDVTPAAVPETTLWVWTRFRLDYGEDCGDVANIDGTLEDTKGAAQFGEVEDYWYGIWWWPDFDTVSNPTFALSVCNAGNLANRTDSAGFYLIEDQVSLLREGSPIVGFVDPDNDTLVGRYVYHDYCLLPATDLEVDTFPDLKTIVASTEFWPVQIFVPMTQQHWPWLKVEMQDHIFYSEDEARPDKSEQYLALKILKLFCDEPPEWWPEVTAPDSIPEAYVGMLLDIVCPSDSGFWNYPGYDESRRMAYLQGYGGYNENYLMGIAQRDTCYEYAAGQFMCWPNPSTLAQPDQPYAMHLLRNDNFVYPQGGYDDDSLYVYMSTPGYSVYGDGSPEDYTILATGDDYDTDILEPIYIFSLAYAVVVSDDGIYELNDRVDMIMCGNVDRDPTVGLADVVYYINYLFKAGPEPWLYMADVDGNCGVGLSDVVYLITYLFKAGSPPRCSCLR